VQPDVHELSGLIYIILMLFTMRQLLQRNHIYPEEHVPYGMALGDKDWIN
jgi:hypothetical protein